MATVAEILARGLKSAGVPRLFGLPGGEISQALEAVRREGLPFVLTRHEAAAAFMAAATARLTRSVGACLTTLGPGAANAVVGLAHAYLDRSPVILVTGQMPDRLRPGHTHQFLDLHALYRPVTKDSRHLTPAGAQDMVRLALQLAQQGRLGPVHLQLTNEDAARQTEPPAEIVGELAPSLIRLAAVAAGLAFPGTPTLCLTGDAGLAMALAKAAERALQTKAPLLIEAVIDPAGYPTTPVE
ncbi:MAG TPA: thiamine pyrophosphate-binding protein [Anaerolineales bacterium]